MELQKDVKCIVELRKHLNAKSIVDVRRKRRLKWYEHVLRKGDENWVKKVMSNEINGQRKKGRPRMN